MKVEKGKTHEFLPTPLKNKEKNEERNIHKLLLKESEKERKRERKHRPDFTRKKVKKIPRTPSERKREKEPPPFEFPPKENGKTLRTQKENGEDPSTALPKESGKTPSARKRPSARRPEDAAMYCYQPLFRRRKVKKRPPHPHRACWPPGPSCRTQGNLPRRYLSFVLSVAMCPAACRYLYVWLRVRLFCLSVCTPPSLARLVWFMYVSSACGHVYLCLFYGAIFFLCVKPCLRWPYALLLVSVFVL